MAWDNKCHSSFYMFQLCISLVCFAGAHKRNVIFGCVMVMLKTTFFLFFFPPAYKGLDEAQCLSCVHHFLQVGPPGSPGLQTQVLALPDLR